MALSFLGITFNRGVLLADKSQATFWIKECVYVSFLKISVKNSFKKNLFEVIKDIPVIVAVSKVKLIAKNYDQINLQEL